MLLQKKCAEAISSQHTNVCLMLYTAHDSRHKSYMLL